MFLAHPRGAHVLVELAVAVAIIAILAALGWGSFREARTRFYMMQAARLMQSDVQLLRGYAIATNKQTRLKLLAADTAMDPLEKQIGEWELQVGNKPAGSTQWDTLPEDRDATPDSSEGERSISENGPDETPWVSLREWPELEGPGTGNDDCIVFSPRGWVDNPASDFVDGYIVLGFVNKLMLAEGVDQTVDLRISRGGLARIESSAATSLPANAVGASTATTE